MKIWTFIFFVRQIEENTKKFLRNHEETMRQASQELTTEKEYRETFQQRFHDHVEEQKQKVNSHISHLTKLMEKRRILQLDDDDLEDERGTRFSNKNKQLAHTFDGVQGWLTNDGVESLEVCLFISFKTV